MSTPGGPAEPDAPVSGREPNAGIAAYRSRFAFIYLGLAVLAGVGVGALLVSLARGTTPDPVEAVPSNLRKAGDRGEIAAQGLAELVQRNYRLPSNDPLVNIVASRNTLQDGELGYLRVRFQLVSSADATFDEDRRPILLENAIQYSLCGVGQNCTIPGQASADRLMLLRRMGLELAVRTMNADSEVQNVTVFLQPVRPPQGADGYVLVFERSRMDRELLSQPLEKSIPGAGNEITPELMTNAQRQSTEKYTRRNLYAARYQLLGGRDAMLQLQPVPPQ